MNLCTKMNLTPGKSLSLSRCLPIFKVLDQPGGFQSVPEKPRMSLAVPDSPWRGEERSGGQVSEPPSSLPQIFSPFICLLLYCAFIWYFVCSKVSLATKNF